MAINMTGLEYIDLPRGFFETQFFGSLELTAFFIMIFAVMLLASIGAKKEAILIVPTPILIALSGFYGKSYQIIVYMIISFYLVWIFKGLRE